MTQLLDLSAGDAESTLSNLVTNKTIYAKIDRPAGIISFRQTPSNDDILNVWSAQIKSVLDLVGKTGHLIAKEELLAKVAA